MTTLAGCKCGVWCLDGRPETANLRDPDAVTRAAADDEDNDDALLLKSLPPPESGVEPPTASVVE